MTSFWSSEKEKDVNDVKPSALRMLVYKALAEDLSHDKGRTGTTNIFCLGVRSRAAARFPWGSVLARHEWRAGQAVGLAPLAHVGGVGLGDNALRETYSLEPSFECDCRYIP